MTHISKAIGRVTDRASKPTPASAPAPLTPVARPQLSPELRALVQTVQVGPDRYGALNKHDPGFRLANQVGVEFHPDAEHTAALLRASRERRMELADILQWLEPIAGMVPNPPADESKARAFAYGLSASECGRFPFVVWEDALSEALTAFSFWPSGKEVRDLLARYDGRQLAEIRALETIANGRKGPPPAPARRSTEYKPRVDESGRLLADQLRQLREEVGGQELVDQCEWRERKRVDQQFDDDPDEIRKQDAEARARALAQFERLGLTPKGEVRQ